jgi:two-component system response regulator DevR
MNFDSRTPVRVLLIDDSPIIRLGLKSALEDYADIQIVGEAGTANAGLKAASELQPDVVLLDVHLPDGTGVDTCRKLRLQNKSVRVLMLTSDGSDRSVNEALQAGATGYLLKENDGGTLSEALRRTAAGISVMDAALSRREDRATPSAASERLKLLSQQERRVVALLADGLTNKEIGAQLGLTEKTVKNYLAAIFTKLDIERRTQAAALHVEAMRDTRVTR